MPWITIQSHTFSLVITKNFVWINSDANADKKNVQGRTSTTIFLCWLLLRCDLLMIKLKWLIWVSRTNLLWDRWFNGRRSCESDSDAWELLSRNCFVLQHMSRRSRWETLEITWQKIVTDEHKAKRLRYQRRSFSTFFSLLNISYLNASWTQSHLERLKTVETLLSSPTLNHLLALSGPWKALMKFLLRIKTNFKILNFLSCRCWTQ